MGQLDVHEMAYLAALPKGPNNYHPYDDTDAAIERRNWVIGRMLANGYISKETAQEARQKPLGVKSASARTPAAMSASRTSAA